MKSLMLPAALLLALTTTIAKADHTCQYAVYQGDATEAAVQTVDFSTEPEIAQGQKVKAIVNAEDPSLSTSYVLWQLPATAERKEVVLLVKTGLDEEAMQIKPVSYNVVHDQASPTDTNNVVEVTDIVEETTIVAACWSNENASTPVQQ